MLKYEIIEKNNKKVLMAKRCSKRNQAIGFQAPIDIQQSFEYQPRPIEDLLKDAITEMVRVHKGVTLQISDIQEIHGSLDPEVALVKTKYG